MAHNMQILYIIRQKVAHNANRYTTFLRLQIRALRSKDQQPQNVAEKNRTKGASPTAVFRSPSRRKAAKRIPCVMRSSALFLFIKFT